MVILDTMVVNVALPALARGLHATTTGLEWVVDAYSLVLAATLLSGGALGDRRGARSVFQVGMAWAPVCGASTMTASCGLVNRSGQYGSCVRAAWCMHRHLALVSRSVGVMVPSPAPSYAPRLLPPERWGRRPRIFTRAD